MKITLAILVLFTIFSISYCSLDYDQSKFILQYEKKLDKCILSIGYFSCTTLGKNPDVQQNCLNAIRTYEKCVYQTCFDAEYIEFKEGAKFNYTAQFVDYASAKAGECMRDPIVVKYSGKSQSTKNYIEEKQDCFDRNAIIYDPKQSLTDIDDNLRECKVKNPKCDSPCQNNVQLFDKCIFQEEQKFTVQKNFWNLQSQLSDFKKNILGICANNMKAQINFSPQFQHYVHCIQKTLEKSSSLNIKVGLLLTLLVFMFIYIV